MEENMTYKGKPCATSGMQVGNTLFTVISVQSDHAKETAYEKVKSLILTNAGAGCEKLSVRSQ